MAKRKEAEAIEMEDEFDLDRRAIQKTKARRRTRIRKIVVYQLRG
jgi:hypothetical protein